MSFGLANTVFRRFARKVALTEGVPEPIRWVVFLCLARTETHAPLKLFKISLLSQNGLTAQMV